MRGFAVTGDLLPEDLKIREFAARVGKLSMDIAALEEAELSEKAELQSFHLKYLERVGALILFSDVLDATLAEELARCDPDDLERASSAKEARANLDESERDTNAVSFEPPAKISANFKARFCDAIRITHPALATNDQDRSYRAEVSQKLKEAYRKGDSSAVDAAIRNFHVAKMPRDAGRRLVILIRQEHDLRRRIGELHATLAEMKNWDLARMHAAQKAAGANGDDAFSELADRLLSDIAAKAREIARHGLVPTGFRRLG